MDISPGRRKLAKKAEKTSRADMARSLRVSKPYVSMILGGQRQPSLVVAARIEKVYGIPPRDFVEAS